MRRIKGAGRGFAGELRLMPIILVVIGASVAATMPAVAQEMITTGPVEYDRARFSGFIWRGNVNGTINSPALNQTPGFRRGVDVQDDLGFTSGGTGWFVAADVGVAARHRVVVSFAGISHDALSGFVAPEGENVIVDGNISMRDFHAAYEYLFSSRSWMSAGALVGFGYFDNKIDFAGRPLPMPGAIGEVTTVSQRFDSPYPLIGANFTLKSDDIISISTEISGFPSVEAGGQNGWLMNISIDFIVYPTPSIGIIAGYKRFQLSLNDDRAVFGADLVWDGYIIGGQYVF